MRAHPFIVLSLSALVFGCTAGDDQLPPTLQALEDYEGTTSPEPLPSRPQPAEDVPEDVPTSGVFRVEFVTTEGRFLVEANREWAPRGAQRFYQLVQARFFDDAGFFRVVPGFVVQFGLAADPAMNARWDRPLQDDPVVQSNQRGYLTFATSGPNTRTTQLFINYDNNTRLDRMGFSAFARVIEGMEIVDAINSEYGERPQQPSIESQGNSYLNREFPRLSYIQTARIVVDDLADSAEPEEAAQQADSEIQEQP